MKKLLLSSMLITASLYAHTIINMDVEFTAFKTYAKKGVNGKFEHLDFKHSKADSVKEMLLNTDVKIKTLNVNSGNADRDKKLIEQFFNVQDVKEIDAKIVAMDDTTLFIAISMNKKTLEIPMSYTIGTKAVKAKGVVDLADFGMLPSLSSINKACYDLHKGKTWQDIDISFEISYK